MAVEQLTLAELGIAPKTDFEIIGIMPPPTRPAGTRVESVAALIAALDERSLL
jgi:hypothetical protein